MLNECIGTGCFKTWFNRLHLRHTSLKINIGRTRAEIAGRIGDFLPQVGNDPKTRVPVFDPARALASYGPRDVKAILAASCNRLMLTVEKEHKIHDDPLKIKDQQIRRQTWSPTT